MKRAALALLGAILCALACSASCGPGHSSSPFGSEAHDLLANPVSVEILPVMGKEPSPKALALLQQRLSENGSGVASITTHPSIVDARHHWSAGDLVLLERDHSPFTAPHTLRLLYVPGIYGAFSSVSAITYGPHSIGVFRDAIPDADQEARDLLHELGHVLGLVQGPRADTIHPRHDVDSRCVMFWFSPTSDDFCAACRSDLLATRRS